MHVWFGPRLRGRRTSMGQRPCWLGRPCCGLKHWTTSRCRRQPGTMLLFGGIVQHLQDSNLQHFVSQTGRLVHSKGDLIFCLQDWVAIVSWCLLLAAAAAPYMAWYGRSAQCQEEGLQLNLVSMNSLLKALTSSWPQVGCLGETCSQQTWRGKPSKTNQENNKLDPFLAQNHGFAMKERRNLDQFGWFWVHFKTFHFIINHSRHSHLATWAQNSCVKICLFQAAMLLRTLGGQADAISFNTAAASTDGQWRRWGTHGNTAHIIHIGTQ